MGKNILKIVGIFILGIAGGIFADQILWPYLIERPLFYKYKLENVPAFVNETKEITIQENTALENAVEKVAKIVVGIKTRTANGKVFEGSGLIITSDGLVVTLAELVPQGSNFTFFVDGKAVSFQILKRDLKLNLALIKIDENNLGTSGFADLEKIKLGERVFLVGVIFENNVPQKIANEGIIKSFDPSIIETNIFEEKTILGSPLFDIEGNALGLNKIDSEGKVITIPISKIKSFCGL
ncbi:MAG: serine protease [Candidatus Pacebacteria bacterium]|nr:serine protease [Candidatus Paceibacterota bacterium]